MADERNPRISQRYRELGTEEPSPELDRAILGAARRAISRHRWYSSLAAAAVLIFAVAIVVQIERQPPDQVPMSAPSAPVPVSPTQDKVAPREREAPPRAESAPAAPPAPAPAPAPEPSANVAAPAAGVGAYRQQSRADETRAEEKRLGPQPQRSVAAPRSAASAALRDEEPPERWLERIARLRELGQDGEADKQLARFRERYPDYRIPEAMAKKVEKQAPSPAAK